MRRDSWLDQMVYNFQHRWETSAQYRATVSGVVGLLLIVAMCTCSGVVSAVANTTLASAGIGGSGADTGQGIGAPNTGTNRVAGAKQFAIPTQVWTPGVVPAASPIPNSLTPAPTATPVPTATDTPTALPCTSNCGGGGGGGGYSVKVTVRTIPSTWIAGQPAAINIHTTIPNDGVAFLVNGHNGGTIPQQPGQTDASGNFVSTITVPGCQSYADVIVYADGAASPGVPATSLRVTCN